MDSEKKHKSETDAFREAMADVRPLKPVNRRLDPPVARAALPLQRQRDEQQVMEELLLPIDDLAELETGEELLYLRPGYSPRIFRRLRRGYFSVADSIDLHHMNEASAREVLLQFVTEASRNHLGCVRVVHGKGLRSKGPPKLKRMTQILLRKHRAVIAYASCRPVDGGTGAVLVLLKTSRTSTP